MTPILTLYMKPGCHLCEQAEALLLRLQPSLGFELGIVDITTDPGLYSRFKESIPVVAMGEEELLAAPIGETMARTILRARL